MSAQPESNDSEPIDAEIIEGEVVNEGVADADIANSEVIDAALAPDELKFFNGNDEFAVVEDVRKLAKTHRLGDANANQRLVFALLAKAIADYRTEGCMVAFMYSLVPLAIAISFVIGALISGLILWGLQAIGLEWLFAFCLGALALLCAKAIRDLQTGAEVDIKYENKKAKQFELGRLHAIFAPADESIAAILFGIIFGGQFAMLYMLPDHAGLNIAGSMSASLLATLDNALYVLFFDSFELYEIGFGERLTHTTYSATVFLFFRMAYGFLFVSMGYKIWKRWQLRGFLYQVNTEVRDVEGTLNWINVRLGDIKNWPAKFHDEFMFLLLAKEYIVGDFQFVKTLGHNLACLDIKNEVRKLFVDNQGNELLPDKKESFRSKWMNV